MTKETAKENKSLMTNVESFNHESEIEKMILTVRGKQVMLDNDLAMLYGVETRSLNQAVKRNINRFPDDFMFRLNKSEVEILKSQFVISSDSAEFNIGDSGWGGARTLPYAFTENGVAMLSGILRSPLAVEVNIRIMRAFTAMRQFLTAHAQVFQRLEVMEHHQLCLAAQQTDMKLQLEDVFKRLEENTLQPKQGIFFDGQIFDAYTFVCDLIRSAARQIILFDNYVDDTVLTMLDKRAEGVDTKLYTRQISPQLQLDIARHNAQYPPVAVLEFPNVHGRFLCVDDTVYHFGASLKDLGKRWFAFSRMEITTDMLLEKM